MKVETDAVLVVFWRWEETVLMWRRPVSRSMRAPAIRKARRPIVRSLTAGTTNR